MTENYKNALDVSDDIALGGCVEVPPISTPTEYHRPGLPTPPAGWGKTTTPSTMPAEMC